MSVLKAKQPYLCSPSRSISDHSSAPRLRPSTLSHARSRSSCLLGVPPPASDTQALTDAFRAELRKFDRERALPAWDGLVTKQQIALEALGVPTMFPSTEATDREVRALCEIPLMMLMGTPTAQRQQQIMQVLGGVVRSAES